MMGQGKSGGLGMEFVRFVIFTHQVNKGSLTQEYVSRNLS